jgi:FtsP/CotA-like multicopper oxidase with cupredoxin domain
MKKMKTYNKERSKDMKSTIGFFLFMTGLLLVLGTGAEAAVNVQCPGDTDGDGDIDVVVNADARCMHISAGDGFVNMADGYLQYIFSFADLTGTDPSLAMEQGMLGAAFPAPTIILDEGDEFYLALTNVGMVQRPDLFDPHTVHWHGFPNASSVFDGVPDASLSINMGATLTYYYNVVQPGTFMWHCHVEATEHMQMGMLGNIYVRPVQNRLANNTVLGSHTHSNPDYNADRNLDDPLNGDKYVYNDGDGTTLYDVEAALQLHSFDPEFHDASMNTQPLPFAMMEDKYAMINGRGYPDTVNTAEIGASDYNGNRNVQKIHSLVTASVGDKILLRMSNLSVTRYFTVTALGLPMKVVGTGAHILRGPSGVDHSYETSSVTLGGGETADVIIDTTGLSAGTYFLYTTNLNFLSNNTEDYGGMMTEIVIN